MQKLTMGTCNLSRFVAAMLVFFFFLLLFPRLSMIDCILYLYLFLCPYISYRLLHLTCMCNIQIVICYYHPVPLIYYRLNYFIFFFVITDTVFVKWVWREWTMDCPYYIMLWFICISEEVPIENKIWEVGCARTVQSRKSEDKWKCLD